MWWPEKARCVYSYTVKGHVVHAPHTPGIQTIELVRGAVHAGCLGQLVLHVLQGNDAVAVLVKLLVSFLHEREGRFLPGAVKKCKSDAANVFGGSGELAISGVGSTWIVQHILRKCFCHKRAP